MYWYNRFEFFVLCGVAFIGGSILSTDWFHEGGQHTFSFEISRASFLFSAVCWLLRSEAVFCSCSAEAFSVASPFVSLCTFSVILDSCSHKRTNLTGVAS